MTTGSTEPFFAKYISYASILAFAIAPFVCTMYYQGSFWLAVVLVRPSLFIPVRFIAYLEASPRFPSFICLLWRLRPFFLSVPLYLGYVDQAVIRHAHLMHRVAMRLRSVHVCVHSRY